MDMKNILGPHTFSPQADTDLYGFFMYFGRFNCIDITFIKHKCFNNE